VPGVGEVVLVVDGTMLVGEGIRAFMTSDACK
jgi:hypothetical protein